MFCPKCGKENLNSSSFCTGCGAKLEKAAPSPAQSPSPAQNPAPSPVQSPSPNPSDGGSVFAPPVSFSGMPSTASALNETPRKWPIHITVLALAYSVLYLISLILSFLYNYQIIPPDHLNIITIIQPILLNLVYFAAFVPVFLLKTRRKPAITSIPLIIRTLIYAVSLMQSISFYIRTDFHTDYKTVLINSILSFLFYLVITVLYFVHSLQKKRGYAIPVIFICLCGINFFYGIITYILNFVKYGFSSMGNSSAVILYVSNSILGNIAIICLYLTFILAMFTMIKDSHKTQRI